MASHRPHIFLWGLILIFGICLQAQQQPAPQQQPAQQQQPEVPGLIQLSVSNPPAELPSGRAVVSVSRLSGYAVGTSAACDNGAESGRHVRPGDGKPGIEINTPIVSSKGPFSLPQAAGCGYGKILLSTPGGTDQNDTFILGGDNDRVIAAGGDDRIDSGGGDDFISAGPGKDIVLGGDGIDRLAGDDGNDSLFGGAGDDRLEGGTGDDVIEGGGGDDLIDGGEGVDTLFGDAGDDTLRGAAGNDVLEGNAGNDTLVGGEGNDEIDGGVGDDRLDGGEGDDWLKGNIGNDMLLGGPGNDRLEGQDGNDSIDGGAGNDYVHGGDGLDVLLGGAGDDTLDGHDGDDSLDGGAGNDRLFGSDGTDRLEGAAGNDVLDGGDGVDVLSGGAGNDRLIAGEGNDTLLGGAGVDVLLGGVGNDSLDGGADDDDLHGDDDSDVLDGGAGHDSLEGGRGPDIVRGGPGNDLISISAGDNDASTIESIEGGPGIDTLILDGFGPGLISGIPGATSTFTVKDPLTGGTYHVSGVEMIRYVNWLSYLGVSPQSTSSLTVANPSPSLELRGLVQFYGVDAQPISISSNRAAADTRLELHVPPMGIAEFQLSAQDAVAGVRAKLETDHPLIASVRFSTPELGNGRLSQNALTSAFVIPVSLQRSANATTGVMVINGPTTNHYEIALVPPSGAPIKDSTDINVPPDSQMVRYVEDLFPELDGDFEGTLWLSGAALAVGIRKTGNDLNLLPVQTADNVENGVVNTQNQAQAAAQGAQPAPPPPPPAGRTLFFSRFAAGNGAASTFIVMNPSRALRAKGALEFFGVNGVPLAVPVSGQSQTSVRFDLAPGGSITYRVDAAATLIEGSAHLKMQESTAQAILQYSDGRNGLVSVSPGVPLSSFMAAVRHLPAAQGTTIVAISSSGPAAQLRLSLRNARGQVVTGGAATVNVPANGLIFRSIAQLFPQAATGLAGSLTATGPEGSPVSVLVLEQEGRRITAQPVSAMQ
jgi:Ca2+-binding RTX toxin-like protein